MKGLETDHVIAGPMRGLQKTMENGHQTDNQTNKQTDRHVNSMTDPAQRAESLKIMQLTFQASRIARPFSLLLLPNCTLLDQGTFCHVNVESNTGKFWMFSA